MEKIEYIPVQATDKLHKFYCDNCSTFIGQALEHPDGFVPMEGTFKFDVCINNRWTNLSGHLCNKCRDKIYEKMRDAVTSVGEEFMLNVHTED